MVVFKNASFITCEPENNAVYSAMAVDKKRIVWIGNELPAKYKNSKSIDLDGAAVTPAFGDTHMHFESYCMFENTFYIMESDSLDESGEIVKEYAKKHPKDKVILGFGCTPHTVKEKRLPTKTDMDKWTDWPLMIIKYDGHAAVCNSALLAMLSEEVKKDPGCNIETGWLYQNAFFDGVNEVTGKIPSLSIVAGLTKGADSLAKAGIGLAHCVEGVGFPKDIDVDMMKLLSPGLPQAYRMFFQTMDVDAVLQRKLTRIGGCFKLALDGCFGSEDAALKEPYTNNSANKGMLYYTQEQVNDFCKKANRAGLQITMHCIGDAAVEQAVTAYEAALADLPRKDHRYVLIHCCMCSESQLDRMAALKISIAAQAPFIFWRQEPDAYLRSILGDDRTDNLNPINSMIKRGIVVGDGSDAPTTLPNPIIGMHFAVNHPNPDEQITPLQALMMRTYNPAYMTFDEKDRGSLTAGKIADFVVLSDNPLDIGKDKIKDIQVKALYLGGLLYKTKLRGAVGLLIKSISNKIFNKEYI